MAKWWPSYSRWLMPSLRGRLLYCLRMTFITGLASLWLTKYTRDLLEGGILVPVLAIVVGSESVAKTFAVATYASQGILLALCFCLVFPGTVELSAVGVGVVLFCYCFLVTLLTHNAVVRKIAFAVAVVSLLLDFQHRDTGSGHASRWLPLEVAASAGLGAGLAALLSCVVLPVSLHEQIEARLRLAANRSAFVQLKLASLFYGHHRTAGRLDGTLKFGAREPIRADVEDMLEQGLPNLVGLREACSVYRFGPRYLVSSLARLACGWRCHHASGTFLRAARRNLELLTYLHRLGAFALRAEARFDDSAPLRQFTQKLGPFLLEAVDARTRALVYCIRATPASPFSSPSPSSSSRSSPATTPGPTRRTTGSGKRGGATTAAPASSSASTTAAAAAAALRWGRAETHARALTSTLNRLLAAYSMQRTEVWGGATASQGNASEAEKVEIVSDIESFNAFVFCQIRMSQRLLGALEDTAAAARAEADLAAQCVSVSGAAAAARRAVWCAVADTRTYLERSVTVPRLKLAFRVALAITLAAMLTLVAYLRRRLNSTLWAALTVAFTAGDTVGADFRTTLNRFLGTIAGSIFGYLVTEQVPNPEAQVWLLIVLLAVWVGLTTYVRTSAFGYAGTTAGFTAAILLFTAVSTEDEDSSDGGGGGGGGGRTSELAFVRIELTIYGILILLVVANTVFPRRASSLVQQGIVGAVGHAKRAVCLSVAAYQSTKGIYATHEDVLPDDLEAARLKSRDLDRLLLDFEAGYTRLPALIEEADHEPLILAGYFAKKEHKRIVAKLGAVRAYCRGIYHSVQWMMAELEFRTTHSTARPTQDPDPDPDLGTAAGGAPVEGADAVVQAPGGDDATEAPGDATQVQGAATPPMGTPRCTRNAIAQLPNSPRRPLKESVFARLNQHVEMRDMFTSLEQQCSAVLGTVHAMLVAHAAGATPGQDQADADMKTLSRQTERLSALNKTHERFYQLWAANQLRERLAAEGALPPTLNVLSVHMVVFCVHGLSHTIGGLAQDTRRLLFWRHSDTQDAATMQANRIRYRGLVRMPFTSLL